jgi:hypothetical protein
MSDMLSKADVHQSEPATEERTLRRAASSGTSIYTCLVKSPFSARRAMKPTVAITLAVSLCICSPALGEQIRWNDATCSYRLTFDARKIDRDALKGTIDILFNELPYVPTDPFFSMEDAARADVGKLERECSAVIERQKRHKLLLLPGLESFRSSLVDDTQDSCGFKLATMRALKDAAALRDYKPALPACAEYVDALEGKTDLDRTWTAIVEASCRQNASPEACRNRDRAEAQKPDGLERKRLRVLNFGWNNCAVPFMRMNALSDKRDKMRDAIAKKLKAQFKVRRQCDRGG